MSTKPAPLFPVATLPARTPEENVKLLGTVAHVCEVQGAYALVHASPVGVGRIAQELGLEVFQSKRGGEYYAVRVARGVNLGLVPPAPKPVEEPVQDAWKDVRPAKPETKLEPGTVKMEIKGTVYVVRETRPKRRIDVRRFECRKDMGDVVSEPYVVTFQDAASRQCSCPDWKFRRNQCKHITAMVAHFASKPSQVASLAG